VATSIAFWRSDVRSISSGQEDLGYKLLGMVANAAVTVACPAAAAVSSSSGANRSEDLSASVTAVAGLAERPGSRWWAGAARGSSMTAFVRPPRDGESCGFGGGGGGNIADAVVCTSGLRSRIEST
jgi:hypothetical protein